MRLFRDHVKGDLRSTRGKLGTIEMTPSQGAQFSAEPFLVGQWAGTCGTKGKTHEVKLTLASNAQTDKRQPQSDLSWTPGKEGYLDGADGVRLPLESFVPDYFASRIDLDFKVPGLPSSAFVADLDYSKRSLIGKFGALGTCKLELQPPQRTP
jgi:hypothetical protein